MGRYLKAGNEDLRTADLFEVWREMGMALTTKEEQERMIEVIKEADTDQNGTTSKSEFLQIMRRICSERETTESEKDWQRLRQSKFTPAEITETRQMYKMF